MFVLFVDPSCGWCDGGSGTGVGACRVGGAKGPLIPQKLPDDKHLTLGHVQKWVAADTCRDEGKTWHFTSCPGKSVQKTDHPIIAYYNQAFNHSMM